MPVNPEVVKRLIEPSRSGTRIRVYVKPGSNRVSLVLEEDELVFYTDEPPVGGRANASLIKFLSRVLRVNPGSIKIIRGTKDRLKVVEIGGVTMDELIARISSAA